MSTAKIVNDGIGSMVIINNRPFYLSRISAITQNSEYSFGVTHAGTKETYEVWGGKKSGGHQNEWYVEWPHRADGSRQSPMRCTSLADAIKTLNGM